MSTLSLSLLSLAGILVLIGLRVPIGVAMGAIAFAGFCYLRNFNVALSALSDTPFVFAANWELSAIPMFLLMGAIASNSGIGAALYRAAHAWFSAFARRPGGGDQLGLRRFRGGVRIEHRCGRHHGADRGAGNAEAQIRQGARHRRGRERRHARCADPAQHPVRHLRCLRRGLGCQAADRRDRSGPADRGGLHDHDHGALLARSVAGAAGRVSRSCRALARTPGFAQGDMAGPRPHHRGDGRPLCRGGHADRRRRCRRVPRGDHRRAAAAIEPERFHRQPRGRDHDHRAVVLRRHRRCHRSRGFSRLPAPPTCSPR